MPSRKLINVHEIDLICTTSSNIPLPPTPPNGGSQLKDETGSQDGSVNGSGGSNGGGKGGNPPGHGTSAGFCNICHKFVSNRTNHKYVHSQVN